MFAVIKTGGKQYRVAAEDVIHIERLGGEEGDSVAFESVLMVGEGDKVTVGAPLVDGATVAGEIIGQKRGPKITIVKKRRRKNSRRKKGHRQFLTSVRITGILTDGAMTAADKKPDDATPDGPADDIAKVDGAKVDGAKVDGARVDEEPNPKGRIERDELAEPGQSTG